MTTLFQALYTLSYTTVDRAKAVREEKGASAVEYALLVAAIAAVVIGALAVLGPKIKSLFDGISFGAPATTGS